MAMITGNHLLRDQYLLRTVLFFFFYNETQGEYCCSIRMSHSKEKRHSKGLSNFSKITKARVRL